jgi:hypothetical protein
MAKRKNSRTSKKKTLKAPTETNVERIRRVADEIYFRCEEHTDEAIADLSNDDLEAVNYVLRADFEGSLGDAVLDSGFEFGKDKVTINLTEDQDIVMRLCDLVVKMRADSNERGICICTSPHCPDNTASGTVN